MDEAETAAYLRARLEHADAPEWVSELLDDAAATEICARAGGLPAAVQREADARIRAAAPRAASLAKPGRSAPRRSRAPRKSPGRTPGRRRALRRWLVAIPFATGLLGGWAWILFGPAPPATPPPPLRERLVGPASSEPAPADASQAETGGPADAEPGGASPPVPQPGAPARAGPETTAPAADTPDRAPGTRATTQAPAPTPAAATGPETMRTPGVEASADPQGTREPRAPAAVAQTPADRAPAAAVETPAAIAETAETPGDRATAGTAETPAAPAAADAVETPAVEAAAPVGVNINAQPWARIVIDDREIGITPLGGVPLSPGLHRVRAHMADGRVVEREFEVSEENRHLVIVP
jgi:hypothetical protein